MKPWYSGIDAKRFPNFRDEMEFVKSLIVEESVYCLPGSAFHYKSWFRLVLTYPEEVTRDACERIKDFCLRHSLASKPINELFEMAYHQTTIQKNRQQQNQQNGNSQLSPELSPRSPRPKAPVLAVTSSSPPRPGNAPTPPVSASPPRVNQMAKSLALIGKKDSVTQFSWSPL